MRRNSKLSDEEAGVFQGWLVADLRDKGCKMLMIYLTSDLKIWLSA